MGQELAWASPRGERALRDVALELAWASPREEKALWAVALELAWASSRGERAARAVARELVRMLHRAVWVWGAQTRGSPPLPNLVMAPVFRGALT